MKNVLLNTWHAIAWSGELIAGEMLDRTVIGEHVVLLRSDTGQRRR